LHSGHVFAEWHGGAGKPVLIPGAHAGELSGALFDATLCISNLRLALSDCVLQLRCLLGGVLFQPSLRLRCLRLGFAGQRLGAGRGAIDRLLGTGHAAIDGLVDLGQVAVDGLLGPIERLFDGPLEQRFAAGDLLVDGSHEHLLAGQAQLLFELRHQLVGVDGQPRSRPTAAGHGFGAHLAELPQALVPNIRRQPGQVAVADDLHVEVLQLQPQR
jgi:hypothetical protein